jgi:hypothetical protein
MPTVMLGLSPAGVAAGAVGRLGSLHELTTSIAMPTTTAAIAAGRFTRLNCGAGCM